MTGTVPWLVGLAIVSVTIALFLLRREAVRGAAATALQQQVGREMQEVARLRSAFLRNISHELRTPLTNVIGYAETLEEYRDQLTPEQTVQFVQRTLVNARRLERHVLDLLDLDELTRVDAPGHPAPVIVRDLLTEVVTSLQVEDHEVHVLSSAGVVLVDPTRLRRIVHELARNVLRHTPPGTRVTITATATTSRLRLAVEDDGPGVDPAVLGDAFEPFVQGSGAEQSASPGLGIGLSLVRRYTELIGGTVQLQVPEGGGTRVVVTLPAMPARAVGSGGRGGSLSLVGAGVLPPLSSPLSSGVVGGSRGTREPGPSATPRRHGRPAPHRCDGGQGTDEVRDSS